MYPFVKRFFDFVFAFAVLLILSPLLIPIMIGLRLTGEGYVFYFQERIGFRNQMFSIWKFATMLKDSPKMKGGIITLKNDPRITPMGGFLRTTKINELPQLINVLGGEMSFVGPRPLMRLSFDQYSEEVQAVIYNVKPGITGIGSVVFRDEEQIMTMVKDSGIDPWDFYRETIYPYKGKLEVWYQKNQSFFTDLKILFLTCWSILFPGNELAYRFFRDLPKRSMELRITNKNYSMF